jgi:hypothetical protein
MFRNQQFRKWVDLRGLDQSQCSFSWKYNHLHSERKENCQFRERIFSEQDIRLMLSPVGPQ